MLVNQAPLETASCTGDTPLTLATYFGHIEAVEELLCRGANADAVDEDGQAAGGLIASATSRPQLQQTRASAQRHRAPFSFRFAASRTRFVYARTWYEFEIIPI